MKLLPLDDPRWKSYRGGYNRVELNVVPLIRELQEKGFSDGWWERIWADLHHQGDVGEATYAMIPYMVERLSSQGELDEQLFHFAAVVELARSENENPPVPAEIELSYEVSLRNLPVLGVQKLRRRCSQYLVMGIAAVTALAAGHRLLARSYLDFDRDAALVYLEREYGYVPNKDDV
jgi:hypothetical protein